MKKRHFILVLLGISTVTSVSLSTVRWQEGAQVASEQIGRNISPKSTCISSIGWGELPKYFNQERATKEINEALAGKGPSGQCEDYDRAFLILNGRSMEEMLIILEALDEKRQLNQLNSNLFRANNVGVLTPRLRVATKAVLYKKMPDNLKLSKEFTDAVDQWGTDMPQQQKEVIKDFVTSDLWEKARKTEK